MILAHFYIHCHSWYLAVMAVVRIVEVMRVGHARISEMRPAGRRRNIDPAAFFKPVRTPIDPAMLFDLVRTQIVPCGLSRVQVDTYRDPTTVTKNRHCIPLSYAHVCTYRD